MKASELIKELEKQISKHGDLDVCTIHDDMVRIEKYYRVFPVNADEDCDADDWAKDYDSPNYFGIEVE